MTEAEGSGSASGEHIYTVPGVYTVSLIVADKGGGVCQSFFQYVIIFDPTAGFVTGGGWIMSPEGAYTPDPKLTGKAHFGFNAKYQKGKSTPDGKTQFNSSTCFKYAIPDNQEVLVEMNIYNTLGQLVKTMVNEKKSPGYYSIIWNGQSENGQSTGSGMYLVVFKAGDFQSSQNCYNSIV